MDDPADDLLPPLSPLPVEGVDRDAAIRQLALDGLTDSEIAARLGLTPAQVRASPAVLGAVTDAHHDRVTRALYEAAVGGETWAQRMDKFGAVHTLRERLPPDPRAALSWLERQRPEAWADNRKPVVQVVVRRITDAPPSAVLSLDATDAEIVTE